MSSADDRKRKEPDLEPDAWERFERAVEVVAKSPPQHRTKKIKSHKAPKPITKTIERKSKC
jgi:hypothetical protein